ncbi:MAG: hypothetical protein N3F66_05395 [Spirochaetes bacterium]|nr:hypothetical protein [Spirochaetota bacterium]
MSYRPFIVFTKGTQVMYRTIIVLLSLLVACKTQFGLVHTVESQTKEPIATITNNDITVTIEPFTEDTWTRIATSSKFIDRSISGRLPKIPFFLILIENKSNQPLLIKEIAVIYGNNRTPVFTKDELKSYLSSPAYGFIKTEELLTPQRLLTYTGKIQKIDFENDVIPYTLPFILPADIHCMVVAGKWIPVSERQFTVQVVIKLPTVEKIVDCTFVRKEYRTKGNHFLKTTMED